MDFDYAAAFGKSSANGYERLLLDAMIGDQTLFSHRDGVETTWALYTPILEAWAHKNPEVFPNYFAGTWGPECADRLLEHSGHVWRNNLGGEVGYLRNFTEGLVWVPVRISDSRLFAQLRLNEGSFRQVTFE